MDTGYGSHNRCASFSFNIELNMAGISLRLRDSIHRILSTRIKSYLSQRPALQQSKIKERGGINFKARVKQSLRYERILEPGPDCSISRARGARAGTAEKSAIKNSLRRMEQRGRSRNRPSGHVRCQDRIAGRG